LVAVLVVKIITEGHFNRTTRKVVLQFVFFAVGIMMVIALYNPIGDLIQRFLGSTYAQYWRQLSDLSSIFDTRYSETSEFLGFMPEFLKKHWMIGVGPSSIAEERAIDSAFVNILHNGGILALLITVSFYFGLFRACWRKRQLLLISLSSMIILFGFGFQTWIGSSHSTFVLIYILMTLDGLSKKPFLYYA
jgi:hypothetical protein